LHTMPAPMPATSSNRRAAVLLVLYIVLWVGLAISPRDRSDWFLENLLVFAGVPVILINHRRHPLSFFSYVCITLFMSLHAIGAHYTYSEVPLGDWFKGRFGLERNQFDRVVHFSFGLLMAIPVFEMQSRLWARRGWWNFAIPITATLSISSLYEMMEWVVAAHSGQESGTAFLGTQGDVWDAQKDMAIALLGAVLSMLVAFIADRAGHSLMPPSPRR
jgi:putative membrane protein